MAIINAISVSNYRSFASKTRLELRPITLLYGWNNAGKSAIIRLIATIARSISASAESPFDLAKESGGDLGFLNVLTRGGNRRSLEMSFHWPTTNGEISWNYRITYADQWECVYIDALSLTDPHGAITWRADSIPSRYGTYMIKTGAEDPYREISLQFTGLVPESSEGPLEQLRQSLISMRGRIQWLQSVRNRPERLIPRRGIRFKTLTSDGSEALEVLVNEQTQILPTVQKWYREHLDRELELKEYGLWGYRVTLSPIQSPERDIDLADTGEGMIQVLPVLVSVAMAQHLPERGPVMLAIEEPESHLHPSAQRALANYFCQFTSDAESKIIILETHSRSLLLGIQLAIVQKRLSRDILCAYWLEQDDTGSIARPVQFNEYGQPDGNWPPNVFADERELARELADAQLEALEGTSQ